MNLGEFSEKYAQATENQQSVKWFRLEKGGAAKIVIPRPVEGKSLLGVCRSIYAQGTVGKRTIRVTDETYEVLVKHGAVQMVKTPDGEFPQRPRVRALVNALNTATGELQVWEASKSMVEKLAALDADPDTPGIHEAVIKITKRSTGPAAKDVEYDIQILGPAELTPEQAEACQELHDVEKLAEPHSMDYVLRFLGIDTGAIAELVESGETGSKIPF